MTEEQKFQYRSTKEIEMFINHDIEWIGLDGKIKKGKLSFDKGRFWLPENGGVNALTVKTNLYET